MVLLSLLIDIENKTGGLIFVASVLIRRSSPAVH